MDRRLESARAFVAAAGWAGAEIVPLSGDASFRRYFRVVDAARRAILMDAPPEREDVRPFIRIAEALSGFGFSAPQILAQDVPGGFLLLEDLGDDLYARILERGGDEYALYEAAIDVLRNLCERPLPSDVPSFDAARALREVRLFLEWTLPALAGKPADPAAVREFEGLWQASLEPLFSGRRVLALFDYHAENLIWLPARKGLARVGLLDFQDAVAGPPALDVVSLLEDARRDVSADVVDAMLERFVAGRSAAQIEAFRRDYALVGAQRNTRIIGVFGRLFLRDNKSAYLDLMPRVWRHLENDLRHPALESVRGWFDRHVPAGWRTVVPDRARFALPRGAKT